jgi:hypothetical protein
MEQFVDIAGVIQMSVRLFGIIVNIGEAGVRRFAVPRFPAGICRLVLILACGVIAGIVPISALSADGDSGIEFGAGLHLGQDKTYGNVAMASLRLMGFSSFRDEVYWHRLEGQSGQFSTERVPQALRVALGSEPLGGNTMLILAYGNDKYDGGGRPVSDTGREAFKRYALALNRLYPKIRYLEIWNEWNHAIGVKDGSKGLADDYVRLVATVAPALRADGATAKIVVGALADDYPDWAFARELVRRGALRYADAFSVHLYNYSAGERAVPQEMLDRLERLQEILRAGNGGKDFPVLVTEFGWPTHVGRTGISERLAGAYISQFMFEATAYPWLRGVWLYELFDSGASKIEREHNFGILGVEGRAKDGACLVRGALAVLQGSRFKARGVTSQGVRWIQFIKAGGLLTILYSPSRDKERQVSVRRGLFESSKPLCQATSQLVAAEAIAGWGSLPIGAEPVVVFARDLALSLTDLLR